MSPLKTFKILIVDDEKLIRWSFEKHLKASGHLVFTAESGEEGIEIVKSQNPDIVFLDNKLPNLQGLDVLEQIKLLDEEITVVFMTAYGSIDTAVKAMKLGAFEYVNKPFVFKEIDLIIKNIYDKININREVQLLRRQNKDQITFDHIVGDSNEIKSTLQLAKKIAVSGTTTILILGESGVGKDLLAKAIHNESDRQNKPFVTINCSSLPDTLLESELFGHEKGAFTDAKKLKKGFFEIAEGGTVFLDEIGEINATTQVKLLGVLENRVIRRLGGTKDIPIDVRIIAATNKDLKQSIIEKTFREDLYYRLKVFQIELPSLNSRKEDILSLAEYFISDFNRQFRKQIQNIGPKAKEILLNYNWPGNIRELRNVIERAVILESGNILSIDNLPNEIQHIDNQEISGQKNPYEFQIPDEGISLDELEKVVIIQSLEKTEYNQSKACKLIGISRDTLRYKIKKHNIEIPN